MMGSPFPVSHKGSAELYRCKPVPLSICLKHQKVRLIRSGILAGRSGLLGNPGPRVCYQ